MSKELTPEEEVEIEELLDDESDDESNDESEETKDTKPTEGNDQDAIALKRINEITGKNFKSLDDVDKSLKQKAKEFSEAGRNKSVIESLYIKANPAFNEVKEEAEKMAKELGVTPIEAFEQSSFLKKEAKARMAEKQEDNKNKEKVESPSGIVSKPKQKDMEKFMAEGFKI